MSEVVLLDGPFNGVYADIKRQPDYILVGKYDLYRRIDDPDTGLSLGAYTYDPCIRGHTHG